MTTSRLTSVEICAGAGGQALGLEEAGFQHRVLVELDPICRKTLRLNRPRWNVPEPGDVAMFDGAPFRGVDLLAGGLPCPPFSRAGKQLGRGDERNLFPAAERLIEQIQPRAVMIENVRGLLGPIFDDFRSAFSKTVEKLGYKTDWRLLHASDFGVPQLRPRVVFVALLQDFFGRFSWPTGNGSRTATVGETLYDLMAARRWAGAQAWRKQANKIAPTLVGGSTKHGGPDLGPTRAKRAWQQLGVNAHLVAKEAPGPDSWMPVLTVRMVARLQGFPDGWQFAGPKTSAYRQVGNAFPPPVAKIVGMAIRRALQPGRSSGEAG